ncbi:hypothetical protein HZ326_29737 [Fusarium oxysporum f. sp. albedinis]|nr:hypothetical protein HZ326_29737 [Fusarium oxysporum f. sp. albedinis]
MLHLVRVKSLIDEEGRAYMGNALVTAVYALLSLPSRLPLCCKGTLRSLLPTTSTNNEDVGQLHYISMRFIIVIASLDFGMHARLHVSLNV